MGRHTILLGWELGSGLGHALRLVPLAQEFIARDCDVVLAMRDLSHVPAVLRDLRCLTLQAPVSSLKLKPESPPETFADLLWHMGYCSATNLFGLVSGWQSLYDLVEPDMVVLDFLAR